MEAGRPWEARDRLAGRLGHTPADQRVLGLLARAWLELEDPVRAGHRHFNAVAGTGLTVVFLALTAGVWLVGIVALLRLVFR